MDVYFSFKQGFKLAVQSHNPISFSFERVPPKANPCNKFQEVPIMYHKRLGDKDCGNIPSKHSRPWTYFSSKRSTISNRLDH